MVRGSAKFDSVVVGEGTFSFLAAGGSPALEAKAAFVNSRSGETHGWTTNRQWSPAVLEKMKELRSLMEIDLGMLHLEGGGEILVTPVHALQGPQSGSRTGGGLGEYVAEPVGQV